MSGALPATFGIVGGNGFRAQYYLRVAQALPEEFRVAGLVVRDEARGRELEARWRVPTYRSTEELLRHHDLDFVVLSVAGSQSPPLLVALAEAAVPVLAETPPAQTLEDLGRLYERLTQMRARVQVAEQYPLHPMHAARAAYVASGALGRVSEATVSVSHGYHGMALIRRYLGVGFTPARVTAATFTSEWVAGPTRQGPPDEERIVPSRRELAWLDFGDALGIYDFTTDQHRSWIRSSRVVVRGTHGEVADTSISRLADYRTPVYLDLRRVNRGEGEDQEGHFLQGVLAGETWMYTNPFAPARLYDDEIAVASCLRGMTAYCAGGPELYPLAEACQDQQLALAISESVRTGAPVTTLPQAWCAGS